MATAARDDRGDGLVGPGTAAFVGGPAAWEGLRFPGVVGPVLDAGPMVAGLVVGEDDGAELLEIGVKGCVGGFWGTAPAACAVD